MKLFTKITDLSNHMGPLTHLADTLLSRVAPQKPAEAGCGPWQYYGCCTSQAKYRRTCLNGPVATTQYKCEGMCYY
ncbi:MAG: hypothetical protein GFH27_549309n51 [Chloroflexi bacterium AL-W]|nr:hypothetical protein [Chloroflexi bacterium AL-N1]NOK69754.1 hypothetical protein [Chloroflexi bacterium AL-N10]NOK73642.1 hypothetical protein [Chloroflexi bacterium AL-N5]NOK83924.1 hypothetical protein [Chloroflexi bacterium AL-W]NOK87973.1 hypothetical protein [Chloroflexi bacterium AL-N15]